MEREPGYYWVKLRHWSYANRWVIGKYEQSEKRPDWYVEGGWSDDADLMAINETRIPTPDEKSVETLLAEQHMKSVYQTIDWIANQEKWSIDVIVVVKRTADREIIFPQP